MGPEGGFGPNPLTYVFELDRSVREAQRLSATMFCFVGALEQYRDSERSWLLREHYQGVYRFAVQDRSRGYSIWPREDHECSSSELPKNWTMAWWVPIEEQ